MEERVRPRTLESGIANWRNIRACKPYGYWHQLIWNKWLYHLLDIGYNTNSLWNVYTFNCLNALHTKTQVDTHGTSDALALRLTWSLWNTPSHQTGSQWHHNILSFWTADITFSGLITLDCCEAFFLIKPSKDGLYSTKSMQKLFHAVKAFVSRYNTGVALLMFSQAIERRMKDLYIFPGLVILLDK